MIKILDAIRKKNVGGPCNGYLDYLDVSFQSLNHISIKHLHEFNSQF